MGNTSSAKLILAKYSFVLFRILWNAVIFIKKIYQFIIERMKKFLILFLSPVAVFLRIS